MSKATLQVMKYTKKHKNFIIILFSIYNILLAILNLGTSQANLNSQAFLIIIFFIFVVIILQILLIKRWNSTLGYTLIAYEISAFMIIIELMYRVPIGFYGVDSPTDYAVMLEIYKKGWSIHNIPSQYISQYTYPMLHIFTISFSELVGIQLYTAAKYIPMLYPIYSLMFIYILCLKLKLPKSSAILTIFGFSVLYDHLIFHSLFLRESFAFVFFSGILSIIPSHLRGKISFNFAIITTLLLFILSLSHHLTAFMLSIIFILLFITSYFYKYTHSGIPKLIKYYTILSIVLIVSHWMYIYGVYFFRAPWTKIFFTFQEMLGYRIPHSSVIVSSFPATLRFTILRIGEFIIGIGFAILSIISFYLISHRKNMNRNILVLYIALLSFGYLCGFFAAGSFIGVIGVELNPQRFLVFGYLPLLILSSYLLTSKNKILTVATIFLFLLSGVHNIYKIDPSLYTTMEPAYFLGEHRTYIFPSEYTGLLWGGSHTLKYEKIIGHSETLRLFGPFLPYSTKIISNNDFFKNGSIILDSIDDYSSHSVLIYLPNITLPWISQRIYENYFLSHCLIYNNNKSKLFYIS